MATVGSQFTAPQMQDFWTSSNSWWGLRNYFYFKTFLSLSSSFPFCVAFPFQNSQQRNSCEILTYCFHMNHVFIPFSSCFSLYFLGWQRRRGQCGDENGENADLVKKKRTLNIFALILKQNMVSDIRGKKELDLLNEHENKKKIERFFLVQRAS